MPTRAAPDGISPSRKSPNQTGSMLCTSHVSTAGSGCVLSAWNMQLATSPSRAEPKTPKPATFPGNLAPAQKLPAAAGSKEPTYTGLDPIANVDMGSFSAVGSGFRSTTRSWLQMWKPYWPTARPSAKTTIEEAAVLTVRTM